MSSVTNASPPPGLRPAFTRQLSPGNPLDYARLLYALFFNLDWIVKYFAWDTESILREGPRISYLWTGPHIMLLILIVGLPLCAAGVAAVVGEVPFTDSAPQAMIFGVMLGVLFSDAWGFGGASNGVGVSLGVMLGGGLGLTVIDLAGVHKFAIAFVVAGIVALSISARVAGGVTKGEVRALVDLAECWLVAGLTFGLGYFLSHVGLIKGWRTVVVPELPALVLGVLCIQVLLWARKGRFKSSRIYVELSIGVVYALAASASIGLSLGWLIDDSHLGWLYAVLFAGLSLRLPLYPLECIVALIGARRVRGEQNYGEASAVFRRFYFDRHLLLPLPGETSALLHLGTLNWAQGVADSVYLARYSGHLPSVTALREFAARDPYRVYWDIGSDQTTLLGYVFSGQPAPEKIKAACDALVHGLRGNASNSGQRALRAGVGAKDMPARVAVEEVRQALETTVERLREVREWRIDDGRPMLHAEELYRFFASMQLCLLCHEAIEIARVPSELGWLDNLRDLPVRPEAMDALRRFREVAVEVEAYQRSTSPVSRRDALSRAQLGLDSVQAEASALAHPEGAYLAVLAHHWRALISAEQSQVVRRKRIRGIANNYITGPALRKQPGRRLFVGREDIYGEIMRLWSNEDVKQPVLLFGQRRMGKTSILLHMAANLGPAYLPVFLDLQTVATVKRLWAFLYNVADSTATELVRGGLEISPPVRKEFKEEPFIAFRKFLDAVEGRVPPGRWAVLMMDEFETAERKLNERVFPMDLMLQIRNIMQHHPRFALVLAGSHQLDEMRREYWDPLMGIARAIKVGYLAREAAWKLIADPWEGFPLNHDPAAVEHIIAVTGGQPLLLQSICSDIVERVNARLEKGGAETEPHATLGDAEAAIAHTQAKSEYFRAVFDALSPVPEAQAVLQVMAAKQTEADETVLRSDVEGALAGRFDPQALARGWEMLERRDMITNEDGRSRVSVELMRRWLICQA